MNMGGYVRIRRLIVNRAFVAVVLAILVSSCTWFRPRPLVEIPPPQKNWGHFVGVVRTEWLDDGRKMTLLEQFRYVDPFGHVWEAPIGSTIDGASIPKEFWSWIGGPYEGRYRNASVLHDVACDRKDQPWKDVAKMFYYACRAGGTAPAKAKAMYVAVYLYPDNRWMSKVGSLSTGMEDELDDVQAGHVVSRAELERLEKYYASQPDAEPVNETPPPSSTRM